MKTHWVKTSQDCPCGLHTGCYAIDSNGDGYCFSGDCKSPVFKHERNSSSKERDIDIEVKESRQDKLDKTYPPFKDGDLRIIAHRGISERTLRFYDIRTRFENNEPLEVGFKYPTGGVKVRNLFEKSKMRSEGDLRTPGLFGRDKFDPGSRESITITVGEWDAPTIYEATRGKTAAVSCHSDGQAKRDCIADRDYINSFPKIILCFDNDDSGQKAAKEVSALFDFNKLYQVRFTKYKDASDYFQNGEADNLEKAWKAAKRYSPDNIISTFSEIEDALKESKEDLIGTYPFPTLQNMTYGLHKGEVIVFKGFEKIGKTEIFRAIQHHLLKTTNLKLGILHFEEDNGTTVKGIAGYELKLPAMLPDSGVDNKTILEAYKRAVGGRDDRVFLYQSFETEDEDRFLDGVRFLGAGAGCQVLFLDHISWLATGREDDDERKKLDRLSQKLKLLAKELGLCICMISHVNDNGQTRGSRNITKVANTIIHMDRDKIHGDDNIRRTTFLTLEGTRLGGQTGPAGRIYMDPDSWTLRELTFDESFKTEKRFDVK